MVVHREGRKSHGKFSWANFSQVAAMTIQSLKQFCLHTSEEEHDELKISSDDVKEETMIIWDTQMNDG